MSVSTQELSIRRKNAIIIPAGMQNKSNVTTPEDIRLIATFVSGLQSNGFAIDATHLARLVGAVNTDREIASTIMADVMSAVKNLKGVKNFIPFYPNFPTQVMNLDESELVFNAIIHYQSFTEVDATNDPTKIWFPSYVKEVRPKFNEPVSYAVLTVQNDTVLGEIADTILRQNTSPSIQDKSDLELIFDNGFTALPDSIPNKEMMALAVNTCVTRGIEIPVTLAKTATDVLRIAVALSEGDISLATASAFRHFKRSQRKMFLNMLEKVGTIEEDMLRHKNLWIRLGEVLHPGEFSAKFPKAFAAFNKLRNGIKIETFNSKIEEYLKAGDYNQAKNLLITRPGDFARRFDHLIRITPEYFQAGIVDSFISVADRVSTTVLLQLKMAIASRDENTRYAFPKGNVQRVMSIRNTRPEVSDLIHFKVDHKISTVLRNRFAKLSPLGNVFIDPALLKINLPLGQRSTNKASKTVPRGSRISYGTDKDTLRFFIWWKEQENSRCDLDLSAVGLDDNFNEISTLSYYNLRGSYGCHSGDVTSAPNGASEFIDINQPQARRNGIRYIVVTVHSYTGQGFDGLDECFGGVMLRDKPASGEVYEPRSVEHKFDLVSKQTNGIPFIIDLEAREIIWCDMPILTGQVLSHSAGQNADNTMNHIQHVVKAITSTSQPTLGDLLILHAQARGKIVSDRSRADTEFSIQKGTHYEMDSIAANFLG